MKNSVKIGLGILAGGSLILASRLLKRNKNKLKTFTAPDGNSYKENEMYRNSQGEIFKNGRKLHFDTPELLSQANHHIDTYHNQGKINSIHQPPKSPDYHQRGVRHH